MRMTASQIAEAARATIRAKEILKPGDKLRVANCADSYSNVVMLGWDRDWITSKTRNDIHAMHVVKVNGKLMTFKDDAS